MRGRGPVRLRRMYGIHYPRTRTRAGVAASRNTTTATGCPARPARSARCCRRRHRTARCGRPWDWRINHCSTTTSTQEEGV